MRNSMVSLVIFAAAALFVSGCAATGDTAARGNAKGKSTTIQTGGFFEDCGKWEPGSTVNIAFSSSKPVEFDVHYHSKTTRKKMYAVEKTMTDSYEGSITVESDDIYCCMWQNNNSKYVTLTFDMSQEKQQE